MTPTNQQSNPTSPPARSANIPERSTRSDDDRNTRAGERRSPRAVVRPEIPPRLNLSERDDRSGRANGRTNNGEQPGRSTGDKPAAGKTTGGKRRVVIGEKSSGGNQRSGGPAPAPAHRRRRRGGGGKSFEEQHQISERKKAQAARRRDVITIPEGASPKDVAEHLDLSVAEVIGALLNLGDLVTINQALDRDRIILVAEALGATIEVVSPEAAHAASVAQPIVGGQVRPPVVTIMGHVDHGKTSLLDAIRQSSVTESESGGITQHIGAYQVEQQGRKITFIDTPGHQAFTAMRARGAQVTDIVILVVAADDGVMPQTEEAITHARAAGVPIVVAINKIDVPGADPTRVRTELAQHGLSPEEWGGETIMVDVSAKAKTNLDELLDMVLLVADVEELTAPSDGPAHGVVIESQLDPGRGPVATILITQGQLAVGDALVAGAHWARVRRMLDAHGRSLDAAEPSTPVEVAGFSAVPEAGEHVEVMEERDARRQAEAYATQLRTAALSRRGRNRLSLAGFAERVASSEQKLLSVIIKADTNGSVEAIEDELAKLPQDQVEVEIIHRGVGGITESDVSLALAADAIIVGFNVRPVGRAEEVARHDGVEVRSYAVIYRLIDDLRQAMTGLLDKEEFEVIVGRAEVIEVFRASKLGAIAGCAVRSGHLTRGVPARLIRSGTVIHTGEIASLRRGRDDVREVADGFECGVIFAQAQMVEVGDQIEALATEARARTL